MIKRFSHDRMLQRLGGKYLILLIALSQIAALLGTLPGVLSIRANAEFEPHQLRMFSILVPVLVSGAMLLLLGVSWRMTRTARRRLDAFADHGIYWNPKDDLSAWREITSLG